MPLAMDQPTAHGDVNRAVVFDSGNGMEVSNRQVSRAHRYLAASGRGPRRGTSECLAPLNVLRYFLDKQRLFNAGNADLLATTTQTGLDLENVN
jgi:hypothetical protein